MRKKLLLASVALGLVASAAAQSGVESNSIKPFNSYNSGLAKRHVNSGNRNVTCGPDTVLYSYLKELNADPTGAGFIADVLIGPRRSWSQGFILNAPATISGVTVYAYVQDRANPAQTISTKVYLYNVNAAFMPTTKIDSAVLVVSTTPNLYSVNFATASTISTNFAVAIQNPVGTDTLDVVLNNADTSTYGEGLGWRRYGSGTWNPALFYAGKDREPIIAPHMTFNVATNFTVSPSSTVCLGTPMTFTNTSTDTNLIESRFYSYSAFKEYWNGAADSSFVWNMGDGTPSMFGDNVASYTYAAPGTDTVTLFTLTGLFTSCVDTKTASVTINPIQNATITQPGMTCSTDAPFNLVAATAGGTWSGTGITNASAGTFNPTIAGPGSHVITYVTSGTCPGTDTVTVNVSICLGIQGHDALASLNMYPNPSTGMVTIDLGAAVRSTVEVYNVVGAVVEAKQFNSQISSLDLTGVEAGVYFVKVTTDKGQITKKITITK